MDRRRNLHEKPRPTGQLMHCRVIGTQGEIQPSLAIPNELTYHKILTDFPPIRVQKP